MKGKTLTISIPNEVLDEAKRRGISIRSLENFARKSIELDIAFLFSGMTRRKANSLSKKVGRGVLEKL